MTLAFNDFDTQIQSDELVSDEQLYAAEAFMDQLEDEINLELNAIEEEMDYHSLDELLDSENCYDDDRDFDFYSS